MILSYLLKLPATSGFFRPLMKKARFLTRDWRMVEPKKTGQPKACGRDGLAMDVSTDGGAPGR